MESQILSKKLPAELLTLESFRPYGELITAQDQGTYNGRPSDRSGGVVLNLENGTPFFWGMRLKKTGQNVDKIFRHLECNQCIGSIKKDWFIVVAPPTEVERPEIEKLTAFRIPGNCFIKIGMGVWHAGPFFNYDFVDFYNLELADTGDRDHFTHNFIEKDCLTIEIVDLGMNTN